MNIIFGLAADGRVFPEFPGSENGVVGSLVTGPFGLINILEVQLGLSGPSTTPVVRIAAWQAKMSAVPGEPFWASSFEKDPWSTARLILSWRDGLVTAGWGRVARPEVGRLADITLAEDAEPTLPRGLADRMWDVITILRAGETSEIASIYLVEDREFLTPGLAHLIDALEASGVEIGQIDRQELDPASTDLGRIQKYLRDGSSDALKGDGTFMYVQSDTGLMAAEAVAEWLAMDPDQPTVIIVSDGDSGLLDQMLAARGLPVLGLSRPSPFRGALQVLSLAFAIAWRPLDPRKLIELLILPRPPMQRWAAGMLASALSREPGIGGEAWRTAWDKIEERLRTEAGEEADEDEIQNILLRWQQWTDGGRFHPDDGIPRDEAVSICRRVGQWAVDLDAGKHEPLLMAVLSAARALAEAIETLNNATFSPLLIERMIDQAIADGTPDPEAEPKAGNLRGVMKPAAIWSPAPRIIWWDFVGPGERPVHLPWTEKETASLYAAGCAPQQIDIAAARIASAWDQGVLNAQEQLILVRSAHDAGTEPVTHPLLHRLDPLLNGSELKYVARAEDLLSKESVQVAQRVIPRRRLDIASLPVPIPAWELPASIASHLDTRRESATSFEILVSCQLRWILQHVVRLPSGNLREIPEARQLFGTVAHELSHRVLIGEPDPEQVRAVTAETIDEVIEQIAAPLLQPGLSQELAFAKERIPAALAELAQILRDKGLSVSETELPLEVDFDDGPKVSSRLDMLVHDVAGDPRIIDLKWTGTAKYRRDEIAEGRAIQLATYSRLVNPVGGVPAGYYLLNQGQLLAESGSPIATVAIEVTGNLDETWHALVESWRAWSNLARVGQAVATGVEGSIAHVPPEVGIEPEKDPCRFCDFRRLCRIGSLDR